MSGSSTRQLVKKIITDGSMTGTSTVTSEVIDTRSLNVASIQFVWTGTPTGTFAVQGSNDAATYTDVTLTTSLTASGSDGSHLANLAPWPFTYVRCTYTNSSGTGTLQAWVQVKE